MENRGTVTTPNTEKRERERERYLSECICFVCSHLSLETHQLSNLLIMTGMDSILISLPMKHSTSSCVFNTIIEMLHCCEMLCNNLSILLI